MDGCTLALPSGTSRTRGGSFLLADETVNSIATDLNLHKLPPTKAGTEQQERESINKIRVWMNCYNLDRSTATQFGKPSTIKEDL